MPKGGCLKVQMGCAERVEHTPVTEADRVNGAPTPEACFDSASPRGTHGRREPLVQVCFEDIADDRLQQVGTSDAIRTRVLGGRIRLPWMRAPRMSVRVRDATEGVARPWEPRMIRKPSKSPGAAGLL